MNRLFATFAILALATDAAAADIPAPTPAPAVAAPKPLKQFQYLDAAEFEPAKLLPTPPARGSALEVLELTQLHALINGASASRLAQARWDDAHEDPSLYNDVVGRDLKGLPQTWALLTLVQSEADLAGGLSKNYFARVRPWGVDASMPSCDAGKGKQPTRSYPSGHATLGYSVGLVLARLLPEKAPAILSRAADYGLSREFCGVHFPSDVEASHVIGSLAAEKLLADPRLAGRISAARAELAAR